MKILDLPPEMGHNTCLSEGRKIILHIQGVAVKIITITKHFNPPLAVIFEKLPENN